jgi:hypothetical protein
MELPFDGMMSRHRPVATRRNPDDAALSLGHPGNYPPDRPIGMWLGSHDTHFLQMTVAGFVVATTLRPEWYGDAAANYCLPLFHELHPLAIRPSPQTLSVD